MDNHYLLTCNVISLRYYYGNNLSNSPNVDENSVSAILNFAPPVSGVQRNYIWWKLASLDPIERSKEADER